MSERTGSSVLTSYPNQTLKPIGARRIGGGELERDAIRSRTRPSPTREPKALTLRLEIQQSERPGDEIAGRNRVARKAVQKIKSQHRRSKLFQSLRRVVKECTFLLKTVNAHEAMGKLEKNLREHFEEEKKIE